MLPSGSPKTPVLISDPETIVRLGELTVELAKTNENMRVLMEMSKRSDDTLRGTGPDSIGITARVKQTEVDLKEQRAKMDKLIATVDTLAGSMKTQYQSIDNLNKVVRYVTIGMFIILVAIGIINLGSISPGSIIPLIAP